MVDFGRRGEVHCKLGQGMRTGVLRKCCKNQMVNELQDCKLGQGTQRRHQNCRLGQGTRMGVLGHRWGRLGNAAKPDGQRAPKAQAWARDEPCAPLYQCGRHSVNTRFGWSSPGRCCGRCRPDPFLATSPWKTFNKRKHCSNIFFD